MDEKEAFSIALKMEQEGREAYLNEAAKTDNSVIKDVFTFLADEELKHMDSIKQLSESLDADFEMDIDPLGSIKSKFDDILKHLDTSHISSATHSDIYTVAETFEKKTHDFYIEQAAATENEKLKKFFLELAKAENAHFTMLEQLRVWAEHPDSWGENTEGWFYKLE